jgi:hypothetical protein
MAGLLACRQKPPPIKVADDAWFETPCVDDRAGSRPPRIARHSRPTDCQPAPHEAVPAGNVQTTSTQPGFRIPTTSARWHGKEYADLCVMPMQ